MSLTDDELSGIPNLGPARRAALEAAGITTRAQLRRMTSDQWVSVAGIGRAVAEKIAKSIASESPETSSPEPETPEPAETTSEALAETLVRDLPTEPKGEEGTEPVAVHARLDRALLRVSTALSGATRAPGRALTPKLSRQLLNLAALIEIVPRYLEAQPPKRIRQVARRLRTIAELLEQFVARGRRSDRVQETLREALRIHRRDIQDILTEAVSTDDKKA